MIFKSELGKFSGTRAAVWIVLPFNLLLILASFILGSFTKIVIQECYVKIIINWITISTPTVLSLYGYNRHTERKYDRKKDNIKTGAKIPVRIGDTSSITGNSQPDPEK